MAASFIAHFTTRECPRLSLNRRLHGPQNLFGHFGEEKNLLLLAGIQPQFTWLSSLWLSHYWMCTILDYNHVIKDTKLKIQEYFCQIRDRGMWKYDQGLLDKMHIPIQMNTTCPSASTVALSIHVYIWSNNQILFEFNVKTRIFPVVEIAFSLCDEFKMYIHT